MQIINEKQELRGCCLATIDAGQKWGLLAPYRWVLGPHLTQCCLARGLPPYQVDPDPSKCLTTIHQGYRQYRQENGPVA